MSKLIALRSGLDKGMFNDLPKVFSSHLKQQALLFDQVGILNLENNINFSIATLFDSLGKETGSLKSELEWLMENQIIFEPSIHQIQKEVLGTESGESLYLKLMEKVDKFKELADKPEKVTLTPEDIINGKGLEDIDIDDFIEDIEDAVTFQKSQHEIESIILRLIALGLERTEKITTVTTLPYEDYTRQMPKFGRSDVVQIVIDKLPLPDDMTAWEQIIDYREDPENQKNILALRRWIRKISSEELAKAELEEEIEWLINEFQEHMKYHKIKANAETLEVLVKAPLEIIEDLVKLKWSKIPEPFFAVKKRQLMLMEAEMNAPGKELAYIIKSREAFESQE